MSDGSIVLVGISIVFICMILITLVLYLFPLFFGKGSKGDKKKKKNIKVEPVVEETKVCETNVDDKDDRELIAVITAAISAYLGSDSGIKFKVKSFRRVGDNASAWSKTSRLENISE